MGKILCQSVRSKQELMKIYRVRKKKKNTPDYQLMLKAKDESNKILGQVKTKLQKLGHQDGATNYSA